MVFKFAPLSSSDACLVGMTQREKCICEDSEISRAIPPPKFPVCLGTSWTITLTETVQASPTGDETTSLTSSQIS